MSGSDLAQPQPSESGASAPTGRAVPEWFGATPDSAIPTRVKLRIWERCGGRCHLTGRKIQVGDAYDFDHIKALEDKGQHRESNIAPALRDKHREKTSAENSDRAKADRMAAKHLGLKPKSPSWNRRLKRKFNGTVEVIG